MADSQPPLTGVPQDPAPISQRWRINDRVAALLQRERATARRPVPERLPAKASHPPMAAPKIACPRPAPTSPSLAGDDRIPAWLISLVLHMLAILLLGVLTITRTPNAADITLSMQWADSAAAGGSLQTLSQTDAEPRIELAAAPLPAEQADDATVDLPMTITIASPRTNLSQQADELLPATLAADQTLPPLLMDFTTGELGDRSGPARRAAVGSGDTTAAAEAALDRSLRWLALHQHDDGGWSFRLEDPMGPCHGQCDNERKNVDDAPIPRTAATGLALLAFMGAGHTHHSGEYSDTVRRGLYYLRGQASKSSMGADLQNGSMYGHGIATLALAEAYVMTGDEDLRALIESASMFTAAAQHPSGGWGYIPGGPADITQTAWQIVALKTGQQRGIKIPTTVIPDARDYLATLANPSETRFGYKTPEPRLSTTAIGLVLRLYFGALPGQTSMREALDWIVAEGPSPTNVYYDYYALLALHHSQHTGRMQFAKAIRDHLIQTQATTGHEAGSWNFADRYGSVGGRLYTTAMCALILETPYRYVPIHNPDRPFAL